MSEKAFVGKLFVTQINHSNLFVASELIILSGNKVIAHALEEAANAHSRVTRGLKGPHNIFECRRSNILGTLVQDASPFLFPCTIECETDC